MHRNVTTHLTPEPLTPGLLPSPGRWTLWLGAAAVMLSISGALGVLALTFGTHAVVNALSDVHRASMACAIVMGVIIQVLRAQRARYLLAQEQDITLGHSYGAMVISHGIGDLLPLAPAGPLLRSTLTHRFSKIPVAFSSGVFMLEGLLDGIGPALLVGYLFLALSLPLWVRIVCAIVVAQLLLVVVVPLLARLTRRFRPFHRDAGRWTTVLRLADQLSIGLSILVSRPGVAARTVGFSLLITVAGAFQAALFLRAFELQSSIAHLCLLFILTMAVGSLPIKIPGMGTATTAAFMPVAGIHGAGVLGFILITRLVSSAQAPLLAAGVVAWWVLRKHGPVRALRTRQADG